MSVTTADPRHDLPPMLHRAQVLELLGVSASTLKRYMQGGGFPRPIRPSPKVHLWPRDEVTQYFENLKRERN